ncbi:MAG: penicillin-binding protein activator LpoB [Planctomycetaceae bacterium]
MERRTTIAAGLLLCVALTGCRGKQVARVMNPHEGDMVGSHAAGASTWKPLVNESVAKLLGRHCSEIVPASAEGLPMPPAGAGRRICFIGVENASAEEIGDFKNQIFEQIDSSISGANMYSLVSRRFVEAGLRQTRLNPQDLFLPANRRQFAGVMEQINSPIDYLMFAKITSGTTDSNGKDYQRDYMLTLELVDVHSGQYDKESATLRKNYASSLMGKARNRVLR